MKKSIAVLSLALLLLAGCADTSSPPIDDESPLSTNDPKAPDVSTFVAEQGDRHGSDSRWFFNVESNSITKTASTTSGLNPHTPLDPAMVYDFTIPPGWVGGSLPFGGYIDIKDGLETVTDQLTPSNGFYSTHRIHVELVAQGQVVAGDTISDPEHFFVYPPSGTFNGTEASIRISVLPVAPATALEIDWDNSYVIVPTPAAGTDLEGATASCFFICFGYVETLHEGVVPADISSRVYIEGDKPTTIQVAAEDPGDSELAAGSVAGAYLVAGLDSIQLEDVYEFGYNRHPTWTAYSDGLRFGERNFEDFPGPFSFSATTIGYIGAKEMVLLDPENAIIGFQGDSLTGSAENLAVIGLSAGLVDVVANGLSVTTEIGTDDDWTFVADGDEGSFLELQPEAGLTIHYEGNVTINDGNSTNGRWMHEGNGTAKLTITNTGSDAIEIRIVDDDGELVDAREDLLQQRLGMDASRLLKQVDGLFRHS